MSFQGLQAKYRRLYNENIAWELLRANNAPHILAFIANLFSEDSEIPYGRARIILDEDIRRSRELNIWSTESTASTYLNQWIHKGWLRSTGWREEKDDLLTKTDASEIALRFCQGLDEHNAGTTASHLRIVQEAVRDFAVAISPNVDERVALLESKKAEIQREIDNLHAGIVVQLNETEQRERIREIYQLASVLTGDFRRVEDEIRYLDKDLRIQIIEGDATRSDILLSLMEQEAILEKTESGSAFESFFDLLCDQHRSIEFREQLRSILSRPVAQLLSPSQQQFLGQLMRELNRESDRVFRVRRRTEEGLRSYVESVAASENRAVGRLLSQLEKLGMSLRDADCDLKTETNLYLPVGAIKLSSPESMRLKSPNESLDTSGIEEQVNSREPSDHVLDCLDAVRMSDVTQHIVQTLKTSGPLTLAGLVEQNPLSSGLEELVAYFRVAKAVSATELGTQEVISFKDKHGIMLNATIPTLLLSIDLFPERLDELAL